MRRGSISDQAQEAWNRVCITWKGDAADGYYQAYQLRMMEIIGSFEENCEKLGANAAELMKELKQIEQIMEE